MNKSAAAAKLSGSKISLLPAVAAAGMSAQGLDVHDLLEHVRSILAVKQRHRFRMPTALTSSDMVMLRRPSQ
eukprot:CAMPEP_0178409060 /NCGR_PEP_ID=MMETSP0689_2-20121128/20265_1 /TAXON_ID=160604 /ORGANISM="Amphidinium massartii, Strain CS-259" /LENGTH=71 /DNA_ID=CAMNT_0020030185 /DNA_START=87 /DNA_END=303 /DNA_ORIENTATION=+